ncbi:hypothetical protein J1614_010943 [Plenodomus biglobosus]|nr:hypothetical protein J1614_010943 [Plenodomus biglobosus]
MSITTDANKSSRMEELASTQLENSISNNDSSSEVLGDILAKLEKMEKRVLSMSKAFEAANGPVKKDSEDSSEKHVERKGEDNESGMEEDEDIMKHDKGSMFKPFNVPSETTVKTSSEVPHDPRYKYTEIIVSASSKTEQPRERPKHTMSPTENSDTIVEYEIRFIKEKNKEDKREYIIRSLRLKSLMWGAVRGWVQHCGSDKDWNNDKPLPLRPLIIFHHWDQLRSLAKMSEKASDEEIDTRRSLQHLLDDVEIIDSDEYMEFKGLRDLKMTQYISMHYLFSPGAYMVARPFMGLPQIFQVDNHQYEKEREKEIFNLSVWGYDWDGSKLLRRPYRFSIDNFDGEKRISELPIYPVEFFVDDNDANLAPKSGWPALRRIMAERAQKFRDFCKCKKGSQLFRYDGLAHVLRTLSDMSLMTRETMLRDALWGSTDSWYIGQQNIDEEIIVDPSSFITYGSDHAYLGEMRRISGEVALNCKECATQFRQTWIQSFPNVECDNKETQDWESFDDQHDHFMLLPSRVLGFLLGKKRWAQFHVEHIHEIKQDIDSDIESQMALPKDLEFGNLQNMVKSHSGVVHATGQSSMRDPINGKGNGLVLLFHGPTGVGKTLTAEVLAKVAGMPLYKAGISEIGTKPKEAEIGMRHLFDLAQAWNAILLIDEADVFLDSRGSMGEADLEKNAMVAVLLREVEYFSGILIMTTNRVMTFDVAMLSRIHWPISFGYLSMEQEKKIWEIWRGKWKTQNEEVIRRSNGHLSEQDLDSHLGQFDMWRRNSGISNQDPSGLNGREIRNIFMGARTMANGGFVEWNFVTTCYANTIRFRREMRERQIKVEATLIAGGQRR